jgi:hypothetical protein
MSVDTRARHAVRGLQGSVVLVTPVALPVVTRRHRVSLIAGLAGALAIAFASIAVASMLPDTNPGDDTATINPSTIPDPEIPDGQLVGLPEKDGGVAAPGVYQKNSTSTAVEPYTRFIGTAAPGTVVVATSSFGAADMVVGESGEFDLKVFFEGAPTGVAFPVTLSVGQVDHEFHFTWLWDPLNVDITAHQAYGTSDSPTPFEKFFGTAPPGTPITITSAYGSASGEAWEEGEWYLKVFFTAAPVGEAFPVMVTVGDESFTFAFTSLFDGAIEFAVHQEGTSSSSASPYTRFIGTAAPGTHILVQSAYGSEDLEVGESGEFNFKLWFTGAPAGLKFPITLSVDHEHYGTYYFTSNYDPDPVVANISQYNTESWEASPWIKFYGTAPAGTVLVALSEYGSADMVVGSSGEVYFKLYFSPLPPADATFPVTLKVNGSVYGTYNFTSHFDGEAGETTVTPIVTESESADPYAKVEFWAPAGTAISLHSDYGSSSVTTSSTGSGHLKLWFTSLPPAGVPFPVTIKVNGTYYGSFNFTSWYEEAEVAKTADNVYGSCSENPPFDVYFGTAPAGTAITITSAYGGASTTAGGDGGWEKQVYFSGAPLNEAFTVTVNVGGQLFYFGMVVTSP